jgi:radical SAM-linked protein
VEPSIASAAPRQRWRLYVALPAAASPGEQAGGARGWAAILAATGLPIAGESGSRARVVPAAPLPLGIAGEREIVDVVLAERLPVATVRDAVASALPSGWALVGLHDVWLGAPAAPAAVIAADYRVLVAGPSRVRVDAAARELLAATTLPRERRREKRVTAYDLRPLLIALETRAAGAAGVALWMRLRHGPEAVGRPEEVIAALGEPPAPPLEASPEVAQIVRERLVLTDDADAPGAADPIDRGPHELRGVG